MKWSVFFSLILLIKTIDGGLISQSSIQSCDWGDSNEPTTKEGGGCKEKFVVSMTLKSGQGEVEALYANINQVHTSTDSGPSSLKKPFRIEVQKSQTITNYRVYYRGSVNGLPHEHTRIFSRAKHCHDGWYEQHLSCGKQPSLDGSGEFAWDSQGFCCRCSSYIRGIRRSKGVCVGGIADWFKYKAATGYTTYFPGKRMDFGSSAHCVRMHDLWYDVYDIELPMMLYNITVRLLQYEGKTLDVETGAEMTNWTTISTFFLTPSKTMGRSKDGKVVVELQGDLVGANGPHDFSVKKLLIPSLKVWKLDKNPVPPAAYTNGPGDWLLADDHLVDLSGQQCNKVGVSYTGFKRQNSPCDKPEHSCFTNQPLQLWKHDDELRKAGKRGTYMVHNFGKVHPSTHATNHSFILRFIHTDLHNSFVTFRIDASDIIFVYNAAKGRIVDAYATKFTAVKEVGQLYVEVENTGQLESEYSVILSECLGRKSTPSKVVTILPGCVANLSFSLQSYKTKGENSLCEVQLFDKSFNLLGTAKVDVAVKGACFCFGECGCTCGSETGSVGNSSALPCATPPPVIISKSNLARDIFFLVLESVGIHGIVGFSGGILMVLGCIKLMCGGILCCRKTKAQEHYDNLIKKGVDPKSPMLVKCTGECRGAKAALARYKRKVERLKKIGKDSGLLDDWRNTSYVCGCRDELADIRFAYIIKAVCFYYYCLFLPFVWLGKKIWWGVFKDTAAKKEAAEKAVLNVAKKKGKLEKYGVIDIAAELKNIEEERNELRGEADGTAEQKDTDGKVERNSADDNVKQCTKKAGDNKEKLHRDNAKSKSRKDEKKQPLKMDASSNTRKSKAKSNRNKATAEYMEGSRTQGRPARRSEVDSEMKPSKKIATPKRRDDKQRCERMQKTPRKSTAKTRESSESKAASHDNEHGKQQGKQHSAKSEESLLPTWSTTSHVSKASQGSAMQLADDANSKDGKNREESVGDTRQESHTSLTSVDYNKPDNQMEHLLSEKSASSQEDSSNDKTSTDKIKSDTSGKNLEQESDASLVSDNQQHLDVVSSHCSVETKPVSSHPSLVSEPTFSQHSDTAKVSVPFQHSDVTMPQLSSSQRSIDRTPSNAGQMTSSSDSRINQQHSVRVQRVHSDQFAVRYLSGGQISVVVHPSHHSHDSDTQAHSHSEEIKPLKSGSNVDRRSLNSVTTSESSSSKDRMYSDPSLGSSSYSSGSTNTGSMKFSSVNSVSSSVYTGSTNSSFTGTDSHVSGLHSANSQESSSKSSQYSEIKSKSESTSTEESEKSDNDKPSSSEQESSEYSKGSQEYSSEEAESESYTSASQSSAYSTNSRSQSEDHSGSSTKSESASSVETSHSQ